MWAGLAAQVQLNDHLQLDSSARVPDNFAQLPECEVEDDDGNIGKQHDNISTTNSSEFGYWPGPVETVMGVERYERVRRILETINDGTGRIVGRQPLERSKESE
jgi:hypothetical protein